MDETDDDRAKQSRFAAEIEQKQISIILRLLEYTGLYNTFKAGVLTPYESRKLDEKVKLDYQKLYLQYYFYLENKKQDKVTKLRAELKKVEDNYSFEKMQIVRLAALKRFEFEKKMRQQDEEVKKKLEQAKEKQKGGYFSRAKSYWYGKSEEEEKKEQEELAALEAKLKAEVQAQQAQEKEKLDEELKELFDGQTSFDQSELTDLPRDWVRFRFGISFPQLKFTLRKNHEESFFCMQLDEMAASVDKGLEWLDANLSITNFGISDLYSKSAHYPYLLESVFDEKDSNKQVLSVNAKVKPLDGKSDIALTVKNEAHFYIIANLVTLLSVRRMFQEATAKEGYDFTFYTTVAAEKAKEYILSGQKAMQSLMVEAPDQNKPPAPPVRAMLNLAMDPPMILMPNDIHDAETACVVLDLGTLTAGSRLVEIQKGVDYRELKDIKSLYNCFTFAFQGFSIKVIERMQGSYRDILSLKQLKWDDTHALINEFNFYVKLYDSVDKRNVLMPNNIVHVDFQDLNILFTDKMLAAVFKIQNSALLKLRDASLPPEDYEPPPRKSKSETVENINKLSKMNQQDLKKEKEELQELDDLNDKIDHQEKLKEEDEAKEVPKEQQKERALQEIRVTITRVRVNLADAYSEEEEQSAEYQYKLENEMILTNACEPLREVMETSLSGIELTMLMTSHANMALALCLQRFYIQDKQDYYVEMKGKRLLKTVLAEPYQKIISSPQVERAEDNYKLMRRASASEAQLQTKTRGMVINALASLGSEAFFQQLEDFSPSQGGGQNIFDNMLFNKRSQLEVNVLMDSKKNKTAVMFTFQWLRVISSIPFFAKLLEFSKHFQAPPLPEPTHPALKMREEENSEDQELVAQQTMVQNLSDYQKRKILAKQVASGKKSKKKQPIRHEAGLSGVREQEEDEQANAMDDFLLGGESEEDEMNQWPPEKKKEIEEMAKQIGEMRKEEGRSKLIARGMIGQLELWLPHDSKDQYSRVFSFHFHTGLRFKSTTHFQNYFNARSGAFLNTIVVKTSKMADVYIYELGLKMYNRHLLDTLKPSSEQTITTERLLNPSRIALSFEENFNLEINLTRRAVDLLIQPLDLQLGFREIDFFTTLAARYQEFQQSLAGPEVEEEEENLEYTLTQALDDQASKLNIQTDSKKKDSKEIDAILNEESEADTLAKPMAVESVFGSSQTIMVVQFQLDSFKFAMRDDTGLMEYPVLNFNLSKLKADVVKTDNKKLNIIQQTLKLLCLRKRTGAFKDPYLKVKATLRIDANYFNMLVAAYEPLIEPWSLDINVLQIDQSSPLRAYINLPDIININLTFGMAMVVNQFLQRMGEGKQEWEDQKDLELLRQRSSLGKKSFMLEADEAGRLSKVLKAEELKIQDNDDDQSSSLSQNEADFQILNSLGVPVYFWEANEQFANSAKLRDEVIDKQENVFKLEPDQEMILPSTQLKKISDQNRRNLGIPDALQDDIIGLAFKVAEMEPLPRIPIELCGSFAYQLQYTHTLNSHARHTKQNPALCVTTRPQGRDSKRVELTSCILFSNNTYLPLRLYGIKIPGKTLSEDDTLDVINKMTAKKYEIGPNEVFRVPFPWIMEELCVVVEVMYDGEEKYEVLFSNLKQCFDQKKYAKKLKSQMVAFQLDSRHPQRNVYVSCDVSAFKCLPTKDPNVPHQFLVTFNPPLCVQNLFAELNHGLECMVLGEGVLESVGKVPRGELQYFYDVDPYSKYHKHTLYFTFPVDEDNKRCFLLKDTGEQYVFQSGGLTLARAESSRAKDTSNQKSRREFCKFDMYWGTKFDYENTKVEDPAIYNNFELIAEFTPFNILNTAHENFELRDKMFERTSSQKLVVFPDCEIVNNTRFQLHCGLSKKEHNVNNSVVQPFGRTLYETSINQKIALKTYGYNWSEKFSITAIGVTGALQLKKKPPKENKKKKKIEEPDDQKIGYIKSMYDQLDFGIKIQMASAPFSRTKIITIVPRYIIANNLDFPFVYRQAGSTKHQEFVPAKSHESLYLPQKDDDEVEVEMRCALPDEEEERTKNELFQNEEVWSSPFSIIDIEDFQIRFVRDVKFEGKHWSLPSKLNAFRQIVRVQVLSPDDATIFICLNLPKYPDFTIFNRTKAELIYQQVDTPTSFTVPPGVQVPFTWNDLTVEEKKLELTLRGQSRVFNLDKLKIFKPLVAGTRQYSVELKVKGYTRCLEIKLKPKKEEEAPLGKSIQAASAYLQNMLIRRSKQRSEKNITVKLHGIGLSFVDNEPKELMYISLYNIGFKMTTWKEDAHKSKVRQTIEESKEEEIDEEDNDFEGADEGAEEVFTQMDFTLGHMQIDDMVTDNFKIIFSPEKILEKEEFKVAKFSNPLKRDEDHIPFVQFSVTRAELHEGATKVEKFPALQLAIQKMNIQVDTQSVLEILGFVMKLVALFNEEKKVNLTAKTLKKELKEESKIVTLTPLDVCPELKTGVPEPPEVVTLNANKMYFDFIHFGALALKITLHIEPQAFELELDPTKAFGIMSIIYTVGTSIANISDAPLNYQELIISHTFSSLGNIRSLLTKKYIRHSIMQMHRIIGSSDLIGNPIGLVDKLGSGVFEFFNEPRKGLLKGPAEFVGGMGKGVTSLVTNVVSGSFDTVSKITGSLYGIAKNVTGSKGKRLRKPDHIFEGVFMGLKGGVSEIAEGITGIFTKPFSKAKQEGAKGFIKGVGAGILGAIASPFTAVFRMGHSLASGVKNTAVLLGRGKLPMHGRFRHPRYFNGRNVLLAYDDDKSEARQILSTIKSGKYIQSSMKFFVDVQRPYKKAFVDGIVIITHSEVMLIENLKEVVFIQPLKDIHSLGVFAGKNRFYLYLWQDKTKKKFQTIENPSYPEIEKIYSVLSPPDKRDS